MCILRILNRITDEVLMRPDETLKDQKETEKQFSLEITQQVHLPYIVA